MSELKTQSLAEQIVSAENERLSAQIEVNNAEKELYASEFYKNLENKKKELAEIKEKQLEFETQGIEMLNKVWIKKITTRDWYDISLAISAWSVKIKDEKAFCKNPEMAKFVAKKVTESFSVDKKAVKKALDEWEIIEWVSIEKKMTLKVTKDI